MLILQNEALLDYLRASYSRADVQALFDVLVARGALEFGALDNGLFPAAAVDAATSYTGYANVWVRDNVHVAYAHYASGQPEIATRAATTLLEFFTNSRDRFTGIISGRTDPAEPMQRPHVRFNGATLSENAEPWSHAQNDALGYFLWLYCTLANDDVISPTPEAMRTLALFPLYFEAIQYWQDEDSGHWEETRKIEASSIGTVVAGLEALQGLLGNPDAARECTWGDRNVPTVTTRAIARGRAALEAILPAECVQPDPSQNRRYDGALLFLVYPLRVVGGDLARQIVADVVAHLQGDYGIRRYLGDSFWFPDYKQVLDESARTADYSDDVSGRDANLQPGEEAQWCIFDPIVSAIYGLWYGESGDAADLQRQIDYFNRAIAQVTGEGGPFPAFRFPELYYLEGGKRVPSDATPLLWTQANALLALQMLADSVG